MKKKANSSEGNVKKAGILTFHQAANYGAVLQAYALKEVYEDLGYETHIINYTQDWSETAPAPIHDFVNGQHSVGTALKCVRGMMSYSGDKTRWSRFAKFREDYLDESIECTSPEDINALGYDVYIAGSDQIWNYRITGEKFDPVFFLQFDTAATKIIYAASAQDTPFPKDKEIEFLDMLKNTQCPIGIREEKLAAYVEKITGVRHPVVLDPTLLAGRKIMERIKTPEPPAHPYILIYQIDANPYTDISVKSLEARFQCPVYTMTVPRWGDTHGRKGEADPAEFLSLLKGARFLVTNSFHGIALSLLFEKNFYVYDNNGVMTRIDGLLELCHLKNRKVKLTSDIDETSSIDYHVVSSILERARQSSRDFLSAALQGVELQVPEYPCNQRKKYSCVNEYGKQQCCGCTACANICPVHAITMKKDTEGFLYPEVDKNICIHCGKCIQVCSFHELSEIDRPLQSLRAYGVKHNDIAERSTSRSGGAFVAFSDIIMAEGGSVYGAEMGKDFTVSHGRATNKTQRDQMKKAKYVQSEMGNTFLQAEQDLKQGKPVLFSGTPCQVAGLQSYLEARKVDMAKLVCCDLVCHGVPSPSVWKDYLKLIEEKYRGKITEAQFRDKEFGWDTHLESFVVEGRKKKVVTREYTDLFYQHIMFRPSCHNCQFANLHRPGDLTLADFWGIEKHDPKFNDNKGVSLVLVSTEKGRKLFEQAKEKLAVMECQPTECLQPTLVKPSDPSPRRDAFWRDYQKMDFSEFVKKYTKPMKAMQRAKKVIKQGMYLTGMRKHP